MTLRPQTQRESRLLGARSGGAGGTAETCAAESRLPQAWGFLGCLRVADLQVTLSPLSLISG